MTPSPSPSETATTALTAADLAPWTALAGTILAAMVALAGVILLFWLQQRAERKAARQRDQDAAFQRMAETFSKTVVALESGDDGIARDSLTRFVTRTVEAFWYIDTRDQWLVDWLMEQMDTMVDQMMAKGTDAKAHAAVMTTYFNTFALVLRHWRYDAIPKSDRVKYLSNLTAGEIN